jgi:NADH-quinone oxidoreductase subunit G
MFALKDLLARMGIRNIDCRQDGSRLDPRFGRASYIFNATIEGIEQADAILLLGTNPRLEAAVLNARIRKRWRQGGVRIGAIGARADLGYPHEDLGAGAAALTEIAQGRSPFLEVLRAAQRPMIIVGAGAAARADGSAVLALAASLAAAVSTGKDPAWNAFNVLHTAASRVAGLDLGFVPQQGRLDTAGMIEAAGKDRLDVLVLLGADEIDMSALGQTFVIYQGTHGDAGAHRADVILPGAAYTEKSATYVNTEGRAQLAARAVFPPGEAKEDWAIVRALSSECGHTLPFDTLAQLRAAMYKSAPQLARLDTISTADRQGLAELARQQATLGREPFTSPVNDFYLTNPIARASAVMAEMSALHAAATGASRLHAAE